MEYNIVSGDSHVDMSWLPGDLFVQNNSQPHLQDMMPRIIETEEGLIWKAEIDNILGVAQSAGFRVHPASEGPEEAHRQDAGSGLLRRPRPSR